MSCVIRRYEIRRRQRRHAALRKWKAKLAKASSPTQTEFILKKLQKVCPWVTPQTWQEMVDKTRLKRAA